MAQAPLFVRGFMYVPAYMGDEGLVMAFEESSGTQTFAIGDPLVLSSGKVASATYTSGVLDGSQKLIGFAKTAAKGVTGSEIEVQVIRPSDVFVANCDPTDTADTFLTANVGSEFGLSMDTAGDPKISFDETTAKVLTLLASCQWTGVGLQATAGGPCYVKFMESIMAGFYEV